MKLKNRVFLEPKIRNCKIPWVIHVLIDKINQLIANGITKVPDLIASFIDLDNTSLFSSTWT